ncbi:hypothetical protein KC345_g11832, partial [Hortaea werneckii]
MDQALAASRLAMRKAVEGLIQQPDYMLIDAEKVDLPLPQRSIIKGDANSQSIAAASIVAKVTRDRLCEGLWEELYPDYGIKIHKGYATKLHREQIKTLGTLNLQVGKPGEGGLPVLKPVSLGEAALASPQSMGEAIESLGLANSKAGREIIQAMQSGGLTLTKETAAKLDAVMNAKPPGVPASEWLEAAVISVKRGLPVTAETVKGLQQAVFGPKLHQL